MTTSTLKPSKTGKLIHLNPDNPKKPDDTYRGKGSSSLSVYDNSQYLVPPWDEEGFNFRGWKFEAGTYNELWNLDACGKTNLPQTVADFYLLEGLTLQAPHAYKGRPIHYPRYNIKTVLAMLKEGFEITTVDTLQSLSLRAFLAQYRLAARVAPILRNYCHFAIAQELRYHPACWNIGVETNDICSSWWHMTDRVGGATTARWAEQLYRQRQKDDASASVWRASFGGDKWAMGAEILHWYESGECNGMPFGDREYCDRVFSLQHNTGSYLNKINWLGGTGLSPILDAHHNGQWDYLASHASLPVQKLFVDYWKLMDVEWEIAGVEGAEAMPRHLRTVEKMPEWKFIPADEPVITYNDATYCNALGCKHDECGLVPWEITPVDLWNLNAVEVKPSPFDGKCKTSGVKFKAGDEIVYHGPGLGASDKFQWESKFGPMFKHQED